jgi:hypothetical protein
MGVFFIRRRTSGDDAGGTSVVMAVGYGVELASLRRGGMASVLPGRMDIMPRREAEQQHGPSSRVYVPILREIGSRKYTHGAQRMPARTRLPDDIPDLGLTILRSVGRGATRLRSAAKPSFASPSSTRSTTTTKRRSPSGGCSRRTSPTSTSPAFSQVLQTAWPLHGANRLPAPFSRAPQRPAVPSGR